MADTDKNNNNDKQNGWDEYAQEVYESYEKNKTNFDKTIVTVSGGIIATTFFLIKEYYLFDYKNLLFFGWVFCLLPIILVTYSHHAGSCICLEVLKKTDKKDYCGIKKKWEKSVKKTKKTNTLSMLFLILGIFSIMSFCFMNFLKKE